MPLFRRISLLATIIGAHSAIFAGCQSDTLQDSVVCHSNADCDDHNDCTFDACELDGSSCGHGFTSDVVGDICELPSSTTGQGVCDPIAQCVECNVDTDCNTGVSEQCVSQHCVVL